MALYRGEERLIISQLQLDLRKTLHRGRIGLAGEMELLLIAQAVLAGHVRGTPRNSAEISRVLGIPRPTVARKLGTLVKRGLMETVDGRRYLMCDKKPGEDYSYLDTSIDLICRAAAVLKRDKRDTVPQGIKGSSD